MTPPGRPVKEDDLHARIDGQLPQERTADVEIYLAAHPEVEIYWYDAGHGFNRDTSGEPTKLARQRSVEFLKKHLSKCFI